VAGSVGAVVEIARPVSESADGALTGAAPVATMALLREAASGAGANGLFTSWGREESA
jgi:hypothetical protein